MLVIDIYNNNKPLTNIGCVNITPECEKSECGNRTQSKYKYGFIDGTKINNYLGKLTHNYNECGLKLASLTLTEIMKDENKKNEITLFTRGKSKIIIEITINRSKIIEEIGIFKEKRIKEDETIYKYGFYNNKKIEEVGKIKIKGKVDVLSLIEKVIFKIVSIDTKLKQKERKQERENKEKRDLFLYLDGLM